MNYFTTGIEAVDKMGKLSYTGNIKPLIWNKTILNDKGKPYRLAMDILADIAYWYKPTEIRDEMSGQVIGWKKKFASDMLQRSYKEMVDLYGEEDKTIRRAVSYLESIGVINRVFRTLKFKNGLVANNVMFIALNVDKLNELTYPDEETIGVKATIDQPSEEYEIIEENNPMDKSDHPYGQICPQGSTNLSTPLDRNDERVSTDVSIALDRNVQTNTDTPTKDTTNNSTKITSYPICDAKGKDTPLPVISLNLNEKIDEEACDEIIRNIASKDEIPYLWAFIPETMELAIKVLSAWNDRGLDQRADDVYVLIVKNLIELAISLKPVNLGNKRLVTYKNINDQLNKIYHSSFDKRNCLVNFIDACIDRYMDAYTKTKIVKVDAYCKAIICSAFDTYKVDSESSYLRSANCN